MELALKKLRDALVLIKGTAESSKPLGEAEAKATIKAISLVAEEALHEAAKAEEQWKAEEK